MNAEFPTIPDALKNCGAQTAVVLGSGMAALAAAMEQHTITPYSEVEGLPVSKVPGHAGRFIISQLCGHPLLIAEGRVHLYEGWSAKDTAANVRLLHEIGIKRIIFTNAAGSVNDYFGPGTWMMINDHINLTGQSPLQGQPNFFDMSDVYSKRLREIFTETAKNLEMTLHEGVYAAVPGPQYETPAEIRMLRKIEADAVGMSTVPEAIQARALGMEVAAFSCLTNWGAGLGSEPLTHEDVTTAGTRAADSLLTLLQTALPQIV